MRTCRPALPIRAVLCLLLAAFTGCESTDSGRSSYASGSIYYGVGLNDPWYYGGYDDDVDIIVPPPERPERPGSAPRPEQPIARPPAVSRPTPRPTPSIPSAPRTMSRPARRR